MNIKILKNGRWAQELPSEPQLILKEGQTRDDISDSMCATLIEADYAEEVDVLTKAEAGDLLDNSIPAIAAALPGKPLAELEDLLAREIAGKTRSGVTEMLEAAIEELTD
jgi:hypothetical protein